MEGIEEARYSLKLTKNEIRYYMQQLDIDKEELSKDDIKQLKQIKNKTRKKMIPVSFFYPGTNKIFHILQKHEIETVSVEKPRISFLKVKDVKKLETLLNEDFNLEKLENNFENLITTKFTKRIEEIKNALYMDVESFSQFLSIDKKILSEIQRGACCNKEALKLLIDKLLNKSKKFRFILLGLKNVEFISDLLENLDIDLEKIKAFIWNTDEFKEDSKKLLAYEFKKASDVMEIKPEETEVYSLIIQGKAIEQNKCQEAISLIKRLGRYKIDYKYLIDLFESSLPPKFDEEEEEEENVPLAEFLSDHYQKPITENNKVVTMKYPPEMKKQNSDEGIIDSDLINKIQEQHPQHNQTTSSVKKETSIFENKHLFLFIDSAYELGLDLNETAEILEKTFQIKSAEFMKYYISRIKSK